jgi:hypothetical protein
VAGGTRMLILSDSDVLEVLLSATPAAACPVVIGQHATFGDAVQRVSASLSATGPTTITTATATELLVASLHLVNRHTAPLTVTVRIGGTDVYEQAVPAGSTLAYENGRGWYIDRAQTLISGDKTYQHDQGTPSSAWTVVHGLGKYPAVSVIDSAGTQLMAQVDHTSLTQLVITFAGATAGTAVCN